MQSPGSLTEIQLFGDRDEIPEMSKEYLRNFSRDNLPDVGRHFESLQDEIFDGIIETVRSPHPSGFERVNKVLGVAQALQITSHPLLSQVRVGDRHGICHQLANEDRVKWVE